MSFKAYTKEKEIAENEIKRIKKEVDSAYKDLQEEFKRKYPKPDNKLDFFRVKRIWKLYKDSFFNNIKDKMEG